VGWLALSCVASALLTVLMMALWAQDGVAPKVVAFAGISTALLHTTMTRSTWIPFGVASAVPLAVGLLLSVVTYMFETDAWSEALVGTALILTMVAYVSRSMIAMHAARTELVSAHDRAEEASRFKSRFLATVSHEIRTPLNAIHGMSQLLCEDHDPALIEERTTLLLKASTALESIVDEVLDHARIESGRYRLKPVDADLADLVRTVAATFRNGAEDKGMTLEVETGNGVPALARFDVLRARQVLANLVSNAVKYSGGGRVRVRLDVTPSPAGWSVAIAVSDEGPGLSEEEIALAFEEFERIEPAGGPEVPGTGLGLPIAGIRASHGRRHSRRLAPWRGRRLLVHLSRRAGGPAAGAGRDACRAGSGAASLR
jgi:signal transduction histidine kinase